jgi:hypothetical protein
MSNPKPRLTQAEEQKSIEWEITVFRRRMFKKNRELKYYQVTGVEITYSEQVMTPVRLHWQFWKSIGDWHRNRKMKKINNENTWK